MASHTRDIRKIIPAGVTLAMLVFLLVVARFYEYLPIKPPGCGFRRIVGIPCLGCGGTRCMMELSRGNFLSSFLFNPVVFLGVLAILCWFGKSFYHFWTNTKPGSKTTNQRKLTKWFFTGGLPLLLLLNWIYLAVYLPEA